MGQTQSPLKIFRRPLFWLLLAVILVAAMIAINTRNNQPRDLTIEDLRQVMVFPTVKVIDIVTINLRDPNTNQTFTLSRQPEGAWTSSTNLETLGADIGTQVAQTIVLLPFERTIALTEDTDLTQYGFTPNGILFVEFVLVDGSQHVLAVGGFLPERDQGYYVLVDEEPALYIVPRGPLDFLIQTLALASSA